MLHDFDGGPVWSTMVTLKPQGSEVHLIHSTLNSAGYIPDWERWPVDATTAQDGNSK